MPANGTNSMSQPALWTRRARLIPGRTARLWIVTRGVPAAPGNAELAPLLARVARREMGPHAAARALLALLRDTKT